YGGTVILKGNNTLIGDAGHKPYLVDRGNPGMATAGMGDVLTGLVAGLLAQQPDHLFEVAAAAVYVHAMAGDIAAEQGLRSLIAGDLFAPLRIILE
ncbi:MAG: NAD(P)H-hydrate dehydratase, partial [Gammaproteobacteria bacterium]|nr:NAD(P)H-hydrate dehydratase [Gammaproteobacteria bacterium]